ncbi:hypothetical protein [Sediminicoccus sp. KRV36]|nr:hypothetical protein [Sediminicoccus rosea]
MTLLGATILAILALCIGLAVWIRRAAPPAKLPHPLPFWDEQP